MYEQDGISASSRATKDFKGQNGVEFDIQSIKKHLSSLWGKNGCLLGLFSPQILGLFDFFSLQCPNISFPKGIDCIMVSVLLFSIDFKWY